MTQTASAPGNANASARSGALALSLNVNGLNDDGAASVALAYLLRNALNPVGALTIPTPGASEDVGMFYTHGGFTLREIRSVCGGTVSSPSVTFTVRFAADRSATGTEVVVGGTVCTNSTTGLSTVTFDNAEIPANMNIWVETTATSGTVGNLNVCLFA